jgi:anti-anti-sigma regulatory factor
MLPPELGLYRLICHHTGDPHRAPNLQMWVDRLPAHWRVVILALSPLTRFDANAVLDLESAVKKLHANGRKLIICGLTQVQFRSLDDLGVVRMMDRSNLCPDLEFAIARGMALLHQDQTQRKSRAGAAATQRVAVGAGGA